MTDEQNARRAPYRHEALIRLMAEYIELDQKAATASVVETTDALRQVQGYIAGLIAAALADGGQRREG